MKMQLKMTDDGKGAIVGEDGNPVFIVTGEDGVEKEESFDLSRMMLKIKNLNDENKSHRLAKEETEKKLEELTGKYGKIQDPEAAIKALDTVSKLTAGDLKSADDVAKIEDKYKTQYKDMLSAEKDKLQTEHVKKVGELNEQLEKANHTVSSLVMKNHFGNSPYFATVNGKQPSTVLPPDIAAESFGKFFKIEGSGMDTKLVGYLNGEPISSKSPDRIGEPAPFDEAIGIILNQHPHKDTIFRATGSGSGGANDGFSSDGRDVVLTREQYNDPVQYQNAKTKAKERGGQVIMYKD